MQIRSMIYSTVFCLIYSFSLMAQDKAQLKFAEQTFKKRCALCHLPPDLDFATDRAWLNQVRHTA